MADQAYDPRYFEEDHVFDAPGILGWLTGRRKDAVLRLLHSSLPSGGRVLDVGCGYGDMLAETRSSVRIGVDVNFDALVQAAARASGARFAMAAVERLPFKSNTFDGVICSEVLEHLEHPATLADEIVRVTKPNGMYCITVPNEAITTFGRFILGKRPAKSPAHKQEFTPGTIARLFPSRPEATIMAPFSKLPFAVSTNVIALFRKR
jgi:2-polyprenyl-3-methyl-5-hydroxy-6-metoxy-1,4-benzoquinol methylase